MAKDKYEVVDYSAGGFFVHGGDLGETYFKDKKDAQTVCDALNLSERLKVKTFDRRLLQAMQALDDFHKAYKEEHIGYW